MKKVSKLILSVCLALACMFSFAACAEGAPQKTAGTGTGILLGHGDCVTEAIVTVDGYGRPIKVLFDDIFPLSNVRNYADLDANAPKVGENYQYIRIGEHYFEADADGKYNEIGKDNGIADFMAYYTSTESDAGVKMYYDAFISGNLHVCKVSDASDEKATKVGDIYLADSTAFNTANGSMRKRYSKYWSANSGLKGSNLGFIGNMEMLENYLLAYGFDALSGNIKDTVKTPKQAGGKYNVIDGVTTGATLSGDAYRYLTAAYKGYQAAIESQKDI